MSLRPLSEYLAEIHKAVVNRWPAGAPGGKGGEFAPKQGGGGGILGPGSAAPVTTAGLSDLKAKSAATYTVLAEATRRVEAGKGDARDKALDAANVFIRDYAHGDADRVNARLRSGGSLNAGERAFVEHGMHPLSAPLTVYRGVDEATYERMIPKGGKGKTFTDRAFVSTTASLAVALDFGDPRSGARTIMQLHLPKGTRAAFLTGKVSEFPREREVLLQPGTKIRALYAERQAGLRILHAEVLVPGGGR